MSPYRQTEVPRQALSTGAKVAGQISRRALLIGLGGAAATAGVVGVVGAIVYVVNQAAVSTPAKTISAYVDAIKRRDGQTAYTQLSTRFQSQTNEQQFIYDVNLVGGFIGSYTISNVQESGSSATASVAATAIFITITYTVQLITEKGVWKIDGGTLTGVR